LNEGQNDLTRNIDCDHLYTNKTLTTSLGQKDYYVEYDFNRVVSIIDTTQDIELLQITKGDIETYDPNEDSGDPYAYYVAGISNVGAQPATTSTITLVSTSAADTNTQVVIRGIVDSVEQYESLILDGTTSVVSTLSFSEVFSIRKNTTSEGIITATAGAVTLITLAPTEIQKQYQIVSIYPIPGSVTTLKLWGMRTPRAMIHPTDAPDFPESYHELVLIAAEIRGHRDLFHTTLASRIQSEVFVPRLQELAAQMGNKRMKVSPVIRGSNPPFRWRPRFPSNYGY
jgi:hypothetical protein